MADEKDNVEELPSVADQLQAGKKAPSPWLPVIVMCVLMPALTAALFIFWVFPNDPNYELAKSEKDKVALAQQKHQVMGTDAAFTHIEFDSITANLAGSRQTRFIRVKFTLSGRDSEFKDIVDKNKSRVTDATLSVLNTLHVSDTDEPGLINKVRSMLVNEINRSLPRGVVEELTFSDFVTQ